MQGKSTNEEGSEAESLDQRLPDPQRPRRNKRWHATVILARLNYVLLLLPDFLLILCGFLVCNLTALNRTVWQQVEALVYYFLFPVLLFHSIAKSPLDIASAGALLAAGLLMIGAGIALAYALPYLPGIGARIDRREHAAGAQISFRFSTFIAFALCERLTGDRGVLLIAMLVGVCIPLVNIGAVWPMARAGGRGFLREIARNPLIIATAAGLIANLANVGLPPVIEPALARIGGAALPLGLMAAGAGLQLGALATSKTLSVGLLSIRHLWLPLIGFGLSKLFGLDPVQTTVLLIFSAVPTASSSYVLAVRMGYNGPYVAGLVTCSTLLGMVSLPLVLATLR